MASNKPPKNYNLLKDIRQDELYKSNVIRRNKSARKIIEENKEKRKENPPQDFAFFLFLRRKYAAKTHNSTKKGC